MQTLQLRAVQFFSRPLTREDLVLPKAVLITKGGLSLDGYLKIQFGAPLLTGAAEGTTVRPNYAHPWESQDGPSIGAVQWVDPYAGIRWPSYALASFSADVKGDALDTPAECDILQRMRTLVGFEIFELPKVKAMTDQLLSRDGYRYGYWTPGLDFVRNPVPAPGKYVNADCGEPLGPGHASLAGFGFTEAGPASHSLGLVWSQAFSFPSRTNPVTDDTAIRKRAKALKTHYGSKDELRRAEEALQRGDVKDCIRSAGAAVDAALRFYCAEWGVSFPPKHLPFDQKIETVLQQGSRPLYVTVDRAGLQDLLHLYRARNTQHEADCYYHDDSLGKDIYCERPHAQRFLDAARTFAFWIDSQA